MKYQDFHYSDIILVYIPLLWCTFSEVNGLRCRGSRNINKNLFYVWSSSIASFGSVDSPNICIYFRRLWEAKQHYVSRFKSGVYRSVFYVFLPLINIFNARLLKNLTIMGFLDVINNKELVGQLKTIFILSRIGNLNWY